MTEPHSEADTRQLLIDKALRLAGWNLDDPTQVTEELDLDLRVGGREVRQPPRETPYTGHQFVDYALLLSGKAAAVVEAKKTSRDARVGQEQALQYAQNIQKIRGGQLPLVMYSNGHKTYFWDKENYPPLQVHGFPTRDDLAWLTQRAESRRPLSAGLILKIVVIGACTGAGFACAPSAAAITTLASGKERNFISRCSSKGTLAAFAAAAEKIACGVACAGCGP